MDASDTLWYGCGLTTGAVAGMSLTKIEDSLLTNLLVLGLAFVGLGMMLYGWGRQKGEASA